MTEERDFDPALNMFLLIVLAVALSWVIRTWIISIIKAVFHVG